MFQEPVLQEHEVLQERDLKGHAIQSEGMALSNHASRHHVPCVATQVLFNQHVRGKVDAAAGHRLERCN